MMKLSAEKRDIFGKALRPLRAAGKLPVVVYGAKQEAASYFVNLGDFEKVYRKAGESSIVTLETNDGSKDTLIHEVAFHPLTQVPIHVDFRVIEKDKPVQVSVPLVFEGEAPAEKELGAAIIKVMHEIEVEALPQNLPHEVVVDLSTITNFDSQITVADLKLPAGVTAVAEPEEVIVSVTEAGEEVVEEEAAPDLSAIEVEERGKKEEGEGEEGAE